MDVVGLSACRNCLTTEKTFCHLAVTSGVVLRACAFILKGVEEGTKYQRRGSRSDLGSGRRQLTETS